MQTEEPKLPPFACPRYGQHEHDWLDCPECIASYEQMGEPLPNGELAGFAMDSTRRDSLIDKSYINGFNAALKLAEDYIRDDLGVFIEHGKAWVSNSSMEEWFPFAARRLAMLENMAAWLESGKYRKVMRRHDGGYRFVNGALNIWADGDTLDSIVNSEFWPKFRDCTERAPSQKLYSFCDKNMICPHCKRAIPPDVLAKYFASLGGKAKSEAKTKAVRENAKKGGWPKGKPRRVK